MDGKCPSSKQDILPEPFQLVSFCIKDTQMHCLRQGTQPGILVEVHRPRDGKICPGWNRLLHPSEFDRLQPRRQQCQETGLQIQFQRDAIAKPKEILVANIIDLVLGRKLENSW